MVAKLTFVATALAIGVAGAAQARPFCTDPPEVPLFALTGTRGSGVYELQEDIQPGDLACFKVHVPAAQKLHVTVASIKNNGYFRLYPPGWDIERTDNHFTFGGPALPGAAESDFARSWTGPLSQAGNTLIVIGMKEGGGQYRLHVEAD